MKLKKTCLILILLVVTTLTVIANDTTKNVPESNISLISVSNFGGDKGLSWMIDAWINSPRESGLREIAKTAGFQDISVAVFPPEKGFDIYALLVLKTVKAMKIDSDRLKSVITPKEEYTFKELTHKDVTITYADTKSKTEFLAYAVIGDLLIFATQPEVIKKAIDESSITTNANYQAMLAGVDTNQDGIFFAENQDARFAQFLQPLEKKWKMSLLLSVDSLEWISSSFNVIDSDQVSATIMFQAKGELDDVKDDAEFIGEAFKRKFLADKVSYTSDVTVKDKTVTLNIKLAGLEPLWKKLFANGVFSIITG